MYEIDKRRFGSFVAQLRREKGMTQKELAEMVFVSDKAVSKWETGVSIPDVSILIPLAESLGVSVTELLECRRIETVEPQMEQVVKKAVQYPVSEPCRDPGRGKRAAVFGLCMLAALGELFVLHSSGMPVSTWQDGLMLSLIFGIVFGSWFMLFAKNRLPDYYDENRINAFSQGPFRMNIPGVRFHNRNWPRILSVGRIWSMAYMVGYPLLYGIICRIWPEYSYFLDQMLTLILAIGGLFLPLYFVARKYDV